MLSIVDLVKDSMTHMPIIADLGGNAGKPKKPSFSRG